MVMLVVRLFCRPFERRLQWVIPSLAQSEKRPEITEGTKARFSKAKKTTKMNGQGQGDGKYGKAKLARITTCMDVVSIGTSRDSRNLP